MALREEINRDSINDCTTVRQPLLLRLFLKRMQRLAVGRLEIDLPGGEQRVFEGRVLESQTPKDHVHKNQAAPDTALHTARWIIHDSAMAQRIISRGALGFAEGYIAGEWDSPDLTALLTLLDANKAALGADSGNWFTRLAGQLIHRLRRNTRAGAKRNIAAHYDLGNDFYKTWLDTSLSYSSAVFATPEQSLFDAQINKFEHMLARLDLQADHHLLEIGSGWGGFAIYAAQKSGCRVTSITLSQEQLNEARARAHAAGVDGQVEFRLCDYRALEGEFDRIVSIEMMEAVGEKYWPVYFQTLQQHLKPGGYAAIQVITIANNEFAEYRQGVDFIQRYVFPGGMLPSPDVFTSHARRAGLAVGNMQFYGADYARTLRYWDKQVAVSHDALQKMGYDKHFLRLWHYYLAYCQAGFHTRHIDLMQVTLWKGAGG